MAAIAIKPPMIPPAMAPEGTCEDEEIAEEADGDDEAESAEYEDDWDEALDVLDNVELALVLEDEVEIHEVSDPSTMLKSFDGT
jgi:hypothetical protein